MGSQVEDLQAPRPEADPAFDARLEDVSRGEQRRLRRGIVSLVLLAGLVAALVLAVPGLQHVGHRIASAEPAWIAVAVVLEIASCLGYVLAFQLVFDRAPRLLAARVALAEMAFGAVVPAGGAGGIAVGAWVAKAKGASLRRFMERSAVLYLLTSAINAVTLAAAGLLVGLGVLHAPHPLALGLVPGFVGVVAVGAFALFPPLDRRLAIGETPSRRARWVHATADVVRAVRQTLLHPRWRLLGALAYLWCDIAVLWLCFRAFGSPPPVAALTLAYLIGYLSNVVPIPGGIGVLDGGMTAALVLYGVPPASAAAAVLLYHAIALWIPTLLGLVAFARLGQTLDEPLRPRAERT
ncbi:MAG: hypothetical protein QOJ82_1315 [Solirubrobacteraceae bacterium]|jgi:uncharacterized membrane protein YbhN (UPF0104 family)|nr:hypothetical protein [Solirubrobacteraceae bacterium]